MGARKLTETYQNVKHIRYLSQCTAQLRQTQLSIVSSCCLKKSRTNKAYLQVGSYRLGQQSWNCLSIGLTVAKSLHHTVPGSQLYSMRRTQSKAVTVLRRMWSKWIVTTHSSRRLLWESSFRTGNIFLRWGANRTPPATAVNSFVCGCG